MSTTRPRKDSTILAPIDIGDQPKGKYVMLTEGATGAQAFSVDSILVENGVVYGQRQGLVTGRHDLVVAVPIAASWAVMARDSIRFRTLEESMHKQKGDQEQERALIKDIFGEGVRPPEKLNPPPSDPNDPYLYR